MSSCLSSSSVETMSSPSRQKPRLSVTFSATSTCQLIQSHRSYAPRIRSALWNTPEELRASIERNAVEYAAEGWDWRGVLEEDDMYVNAETGEHIHPVHVERRLDAARMQISHRNWAAECHKDQFIEKSREAARDWSSEPLVFEFDP